MTRDEEIINAGINYTLQTYPVCIGGDNFSEQMRDFNRNKSFEAGANWADEHPYWRPATEHPIADVEVIALVGKYLKVVFAHIVKDRERVVDYDGWNIPEVKWWMPIQSIEELEENEW